MVTKFYLSSLPTKEETDFLNECRFVGKEGFQDLSPWELEEGFLKLLGDNLNEAIEWLEFTASHLPRLEFRGLERLGQYHLTVMDGKVLLYKTSFLYTDIPKRGFDIPVQTFLHFLGQGRWGEVEIGGQWEFPEGMRCKDDFDIATGLVSVQYFGGKKKKQYYSGGTLVLKIWDWNGGNPRAIQFPQTGLQPSPEWEWVGYWEKLNSEFHGMQGNLHLTYVAGKLVVWGQKDTRTIAEMMFLDAVKDEFEGISFQRGDFNLRCHFREIVRQHRDRIEEFLEKGWHRLNSILQPEDWKDLTPQLLQFGLEAQVFDGVLQFEEAKELATSGLRKGDILYYKTFFDPPTKEEWLIKIDLAKEDWESLRDIASRFDSDLSVHLQMSKGLTAIFATSFALLYADIPAKIERLDRSLPKVEVKIPNGFFRLELPDRCDFVRLKIGRNSITFGWNDENYSYRDIEAIARGDSPFWTPEQKGLSVQIDREELMISLLPHDLAVEISIQNNRCKVGNRVISCVPMGMGMRSFHVNPHLLKSLLGYLPERVVLQIPDRGPICLRETKSKERQHDRTVKASFYFFPLEIGGDNDFSLSTPPREEKKEDYRLPLVWEEHIFSKQYSIPYFGYASLEELYTVEEECSDLYWNCFTERFQEWEMLLAQLNYLLSHNEVAGDEPIREYCQYWVERIPDPEDEDCCDNLAWEEMLSDVGNDLDEELLKLAIWKARLEQKMKDRLSFYQPQFDLDACETIGLPNEPFAIKKVTQF